MDFSFSPSGLALQRDIRATLVREWPAGRRGWRKGERDFDYEEDKRVRRELGRHGWFGLGFPERYGGSGGDHEARYVVASEMAYHGVPYAKVAINMVGPMLLEHGSEELKERVVPGIASGELEISQAYSEPGAGSDLAALRTRAVRDGDRYVITGQKIYTSLFHRSECCVVAARTDPDARPHDGISLFLVDVDAPGVETQPLWGMGEIRANMTYWDNVEVPASNLIGEENRGWAYLRTGLSLERLTAYGVAELRAMLDDLVEHVCRDPALSGDSVVRDELAQLVVEIEVLDALTLRALWLLSSAPEVPVESSRVKVFATELHQRVGRVALGIMGHRAQLTAADPTAPIGGAVLQASEAAVHQTFGAGANEIQRDIIASLGLGLPRRR
jgi:3-oxocholest-4-en-26-oyl-CoA dehydrogenase alpha subunit